MLTQQATTNIGIIFQLIIDQAYNKLNIAILTLDQHIDHSNYAWKYEFMLVKTLTI